MLAQELIRIKRDGGALPPEEIALFVKGLTDGSVSEAQVAAMAMAVFFRGLKREETVALTLAMRDSGTVLKWPELDRPVTDKHSTGGVGDNVSLMLAPIVAACGGAVPMISGRALGHTGGTLDKMDSIPGYVTQPDEALFRKVTKQIGCAIIGQTADLAPADKRFYAIRDVTATVESVYLITASILSKKLAAGLQSLVLDVKAGNGAFMSSLERARELAQSLVAVANGAGLKTSGQFLTDMNEPLASAAGNGLEVVNAVEFLTGARTDARLKLVTLSLAAEMLVSSGLAANDKDGFAKAETALHNGKAADVFGQMVAALGGPIDLVENPQKYIVAAPLMRDVLARKAGYAASCDTRAIGVAVLDLGGGRRKTEDKIDHRVGFDRLVPLGTRVEKGDVIGRVHAADEPSLKKATDTLIGTYEFVESALPDRPAIIEKI
ncbi:MAG: thymidine phosphorylase [Notoacmeibacter sp.]